MEKSAEPACRQAGITFFLEFSLPTGRQVWLLSLFQDKESDTRSSWRWKTPTGRDASPYTLDISCSY
jgi:hypothetical protein